MTRAGIDPLDAFLVGFVLTDACMVGSLVIDTSILTISSVTGTSGTPGLTTLVTESCVEVEDRLLFRRLNHGHLLRFRCFVVGSNFVARGEMRRIGIDSSACASMTNSRDSVGDSLGPQRGQHRRLPVVVLDEGDGGLRLRPPVPSSCWSMVRMMYRFGR